MENDFRRYYYVVRPNAFYTFFLFKRFDRARTFARLHQCCWCSSISHTLLLLSCTLHLHLSNDLSIFLAYLNCNRKTEATATSKTNKISIQRKRKEKRLRRRKKKIEKLIANGWNWFRFLFHRTHLASIKFTIFLCRIAAQINLWRNIYTRGWEHF